MRKDIFFLNKLKKNSINLLLMLLLSSIFVFDILINKLLIKVKCL
ncbi:MAG: hypothetical protein PWP46_1102 [Fusobacteriaceae bacterium]|jgi:hypothetical protein|nr:hypothetical protein [Fusobacteriales bacterium]MDN5304220.1 hypothetical protein [Fusobacteriaceae bacterium]